MELPSPATCDKNASREARPSAVSAQLFRSALTSKQE
jgi:hypothetical protein